jgi:mRNA interferase MazF
MATRIDLAKRLLQRADDDEAAAKAMLPIESVTDVIVGMLAQQAVEKSLKAVLSFSAVNFPFVHDIDELTVLCTNAGHPLPDSLRGVDQLTLMRAPCDTTPRTRSWSIARRRCAGPHSPSPGPAESSKLPRSRWHPRTRPWTEPMRAIHIAQLDKSRPVLVLTRELVRPTSRPSRSPITTRMRGLSTEVRVGAANGLAGPSIVNCESITTIPVDALRDPDRRTARQSRTGAARRNRRRLRLGLIAHCRPHLRRQRCDVLESRT